MPFSAGTLTNPAPSPQSSRPGACSCFGSDKPTLGNRLRAPLQALAALEDPPHERMRLQLLQKVVHRELCVAVVEPDHHAERDHVVAERIDEGAAELAVAGTVAERPAHRVDHPIEGPRHFPDLLDAQRPHLWVLARECEAVDRSAGEMALRPLAENGDARNDIGARLEVRELLGRTPAAPVACAHAANPPVLDEQLRRRRLGQDRRAALLRLLAEPPSELRKRRDVVVVVLHRRRSRDAKRLVPREVVDRLRSHLSEERHVRDPLAVPEQHAQRARVDHSAREEMGADLLALFEHGDGNLAEPPGDLRLLLEQLAETDRAREPRGPRTDDQDADLDPLFARIRRLGNRLAQAERWRILGRARHALRCFTSSVSFGTISFRSPTTPRSANSKIGAFPSLLIATTTPELCIPTLCWIAPETPTAMYSFGETVLPVCPTWAAYGYQPASTTARVAATAPPSACASSSTTLKFSGAPSPRPPATITCASSIDGPSLSACACSTIVAAVEKSCSSTCTSSTCASPPDSCGSKAPERNSASRGSDFQPTSTITESCKAGRLPTSAPSCCTRSVRSQLSPASSLAARPAATSAASTLWPNSTVS